MPNPERIINKVATLVPVGSPESVRWSPDVWNGKDSRGRFTVVKFARPFFSEQSPGTQTVHVLVDGNTIEKGQALANDFTTGPEKVLYEYRLGTYSIVFLEHTIPSSEAV